MTTWRRILWTVLLTGLVGAACLWSILYTSLAEMVRESIVMPIVYSLWLVGLQLRSFDQELLWVTLLVILGIIFFYLLSRAWNIHLRPPVLTQPRQDDPGTVHWSIQFWNSKIHNLRSHGVESEFSILEFRLLGRQVLAFTHGHTDSGGRIPEHVPQSAIEEAPASIQPLLRRPGAGKERRSLPLAKRKLPLAKNWLSLARHTLKNLRLLGLRTPAAVPPSDPVLDLCIYLEQQLEIDHEPPEPDR